MRRLKEKLQTVYSRTFIVLSVLCAVMFIVYNMALLGLVKNVYADFIIDSNQRVLRQSSTYFDALVADLYNNASLLSEDRNVLNAAGIPSVSYYERNSAIMEKLETIAKNSTFIDTAYLLLNDNAFFLSSEGVFTRLALYHETELAEFLSQDFSTSGIYKHVTASGEERLYFVFPFPQHRQFFLGNIVFELNTEFFSNMLDSDSGAEGGFYVLNADQSLCVSSLQISEDLILTGESAQGLPASGEYITYRGNGYYLQQSKVSSLQYVYVVSSAQLALSSIITNSFFIPVTVLMIVLLILFSSVATRYTYIPLTKVMRVLQKHTGEEAARRKPVNEYQQITDHFHQLMTENQEKEDVIQQVAPFMQDALILNLLRGSSWEKELAFYQKFVDVQSLEAWLCMVCVLSLDKTADDSRTEEKLGILQHIAGDADQSLRKSCFRFEDNTLVLLYSCDMSETQDLDLHETVLADLTRIRKQSDGNLEATFTAGVSEPHRGISQIYAAYTEALGALRYRLYNPPGTVIQYGVIKDSLDHIQTDVWPMYEQDEKSIINAVVSGEVAALDSSLERFYGHLQESAGPDRHYIILVFTLLLKQLGQHFDPVSIADAVYIRNSKKQFTILEKMENANEMLKYVKDVCHTVQQRLVSADTADQHRFTKKVREYIAAHYQENSLSLSTVAEYLGISKSYMSTLFKREFNTNFVDYVNTLRIRKAKELLETTSLSVQEIGEAVGYGSIQSFLRIFSKQEGITPKRYRDNFLRLKG